MTGWAIALAVVGAGCDALGARWQNRAVQDTDTDPSSAHPATLPARLLTGGTESLIRLLMLPGSTAVLALTRRRCLPSHRRGHPASPAERVGDEPGC